MVLLRGYKAFGFVRPKFRGALIYETQRQGTSMEHQRAAVGTVHIFQNEVQGSVSHR